MNNQNFLVAVDATIREAIDKIERNGFGIVFIERDKKIIGCATDGDIRRSLLKNIDIDDDIKVCSNSNFVFLKESSWTKENILKLLDSKIRAIPILNDQQSLITVVSQKNLNWDKEERIISKAKSPVRISFAGGGTDLTNYFYEDSGVVLNATINKFAHAVLQKRDDKRIKIYSNDLKVSVNVADFNAIKYDGELDLIKALIILLKPDFGFELYTYSDVPPGSGLGGSAVLLSAIVGAFNNFRENTLSSYEIAELAFHAERIELGLSGGWQDQYATVFGGFNFMEFKNHENIINPLRISEDIKNDLEDSLILCYTGINHNSGNIHNDQKENMKKSDLKSAAVIAKDIAFEMKSRLLKGKLNDFGELLHKAWTIKKKFSSKISNNYLDDIYEYALNNGALGGKLLGAGAGGYFLFCVPTFKKLDLINALQIKNLEIESFTFDDKGLRSWIIKEEK